jgi:hypothetical protein
MTEAILAKTLSKYIDILNKYGAESKEAKEFRYRYEDNKELLSLFDSAELVKEMFEEEEL